jgi:hypothetical protein
MSDADFYQINKYLKFLNLPKLKKPEPQIPSLRGPLKRLGFVFKGHGYLYFSQPPKDLYSREA